MCANVSVDFLAFAILIALHLRWAWRENRAEKQRNEIRVDLLNTLHKVVDAQTEMRPMINRIARYIGKVDVE